MTLENTKSMFTELAELIAESQADELAVKQRLMMPREKYIEQKTQGLIHDLEKEHKKTLSYMDQARNILLEEIRQLPLAEQEHHAKDILIAVDKLSKNIELDQVEKAGSYQQLLGFSNETMLWIYQLGSKFFGEKHYEKALSLFLMLTLLNPLICEHWTCLGFTQKNLSLEPSALLSFSTAALLSPENPTPRLQGAEIHLHLGDFDKALIELEALREIIESQNLSSLKPQLELMMNKAQNRQSL